MPAFFPAALPGLLSNGESWKSRVREGAYTSPTTKTRITFLYEDVSRSFEKRGTIFEFAGVDEAYIQEKGFGPRQYPMVCYFSGSDHDMVATAFEAALLERGIGKLEHPFYGTVNVLPFGTITRRDDLKTAANQTAIEVTFWTTLKEVYPRAGSDPKNEITSAIDGFDVVAAQQFAAKANLADAVSKANAKATAKGFLRDVSATLQAASDATASVRREFDDGFRLLNDGIDVLIGQPLLLAQQVSNLIQAPARAASGILSRLAGYEALAARLFASPAGRPASSVPEIVASQRQKLVNNVQVANLFATSAVAGSVVAVVNTRFTTKPEALIAADRVLNLFDAASAWRDSSFGTLDVVDTGEDYQALQQAVAMTAGFLVQVSFALVPERRIVLDRARTIIDLAAELYGSVDDKLDLLINTNNLTGSEILELSRGRVIKYYPAA